MVTERYYTICTLYTTRTWVRGNSWHSGKIYCFDKFSLSKGRPVWGNILKFWSVRNLCFIYKGCNYQYLIIDQDTHKCEQ